MKIAIGVFLIGVLLLIGKKQIRKVFEFLSVYWFRLAFSFLLLFVLNVAAGFLGVYVPVNIASGLVIAILGVPGVISLCTLAILL